MFFLALLPSVDALAVLLAFLLCASSRPLLCPLLYNWRARGSPGYEEEEEEDGAASKSSHDEATMAS